MKKLCVVSCPIATRSGYGSRSRDLVRSLIQTKGEEWDIKILPQRWGNTPQNVLTSEDVDLTSRLITGQMNQKPDVWVQITIPSEFQPVGHFNIGVSAVIETTNASPERSGYQLGSLHRLQRCPLPQGWDPFKLEGRRRLNGLTWSRRMRSH